MISMAYIFTIIFISKPLSVEMAYLLGIQNKIQAVWLAETQNSLFNISLSISFYISTWNKKQFLQTMLAI